MQPIARVTSASDDPEDSASGGSAATERLDVSFAAVFTILFFAALLPRALGHVLWRDEWHTWQFVLAAPDLPTLFERLRYDGHPSLWYLLLYTASRVWADPVVMKLTHVVIATGVVALITAAAPLMRWQRGMLACGYFIAFEYAVISRNYALGVFFLLLAAAISAKRPTAYIGIAAALAAAVQSNAFAGMLAVVMAAWTFWNWFRHGKPHCVRFVVGSAILAASCAFAAWTVRQPADIANTDTFTRLDLARAVEVAASPWRSFVPIPTLGRAWWNTNALDSALPEGSTRAIQAGLGLVTILLAIALLPARRGVRLLWLGGTTLVLAFGYLKIVGYQRHHGHLFIFFIVALWLGIGPNAKSDLRRGWKRIGFVLLLLLQAIAGVTASLLDVSMPFSASRAAADFIRSRYPDAAIVSYVDFSTSSVSGELGRPLYAPIPERWTTYVQWDTRRVGTLTQADLTRAAERVQALVPGRRILLLLSADASLSPDPRAFAFVAEFDDTSINTEAYALFEFRDLPPSQTVAPGTAATRPATEAQDAAGRTLER